MESIMEAKEFSSHYEWWINRIGEKATIINSDWLHKADQILDNFNHQKPLFIVCPKGIAGADIREMVVMKKVQAEEFALKGIDLILRIIRFPSIVFGFFDQYLLGGGLEFSLACDFLFTTKKCKFGFPEVTLGITPGFLGIELGILKGLQFSYELFLLGKIETAEISQRFSLFHDVFEDFESMLGFKEKTINSLEQLSYRAVALAKKRYTQMILQLNKEQIAKGFSESFEESDQIEGMKAFIEKRKANFLN